MARDGKDKKGRGHGPSRDVQISKAMSLLLRHAAEKEGLKMNAQGYANVADVVRPFPDSNEYMVRALTIPATMAEAQVPQSDLRGSATRR